MKEISEIASRHSLKIVEDACHAIQGQYCGKYAGTLGDIGCFSMHPLKNLNIWGDGGFIVTNNKDIDKKIRLIRNHGLIDRDHCEEFAYNSRLDTLQAIVANHLLEKIDHITAKRINNAEYYDRKLKKISQLQIPNRNSDKKHVYHLYIIQAQRRNQLKEFLESQGVDAKIHYPVPMHLQPASKKWGYKKGDFPATEKICNSVISLPTHEFITSSQQDHIVECIEEFYAKNH